MKKREILKKTFQEFFSDDPLTYSSSIAFNVIFSLPAILMIIITIGGSVFEDQVVRQNLIQQIQNLFGAESSEAIERILDSLENYGSNLFTKIIGFIVLGFSATAVFVSLQNVLNNIWGIKAKPENDWLNFIKNRVLSLAMVATIGFLVLVSLGLDTALSLLKDWIEMSYSEDIYYIITAINILFSLVVITVVFAFIFKILPDAEIKWSDVWVGAIFTTVFFNIGKYLMGFYLGSSPLGNMYGAASSLVLLLLWVFFSATIVLLGAEFTYIYSRAMGNPIKPKKHAVFVELVEKESKPD